MVQGSIAATAGENAQDGTAVCGDVTNGATSNVGTGICGVCSGSGERCYEYNFRRMAEQCKHCDGNGVFLSQATKDKIAAIPNRTGTFVPGIQRIMTQKQQSVTLVFHMLPSRETQAQLCCWCRERVKTLRCQLAKVDKKIRDLDDEHTALARQVMPGPEQQALNDNVIQALETAILSLTTTKQSREDRLSYYDGMVEADDVTQSIHGECSDGSVGSRSTASSSGTAMMDSS